jgi:hypothetical protein
VKSPNIAVDMLISAALAAEQIHGWADQCLSDAGCGDEHEPLDALAEAMADVRRATREFTHYSDGRHILTTTEIEPDRPGHNFTYTFPAIIEHRGERLLAEGPRPADPEEGNRGQYRVFVDDAACTVRIELTPPPTPRRHLGLAR